MKYIIIIIIIISEMKMNNEERLLAIIQLTNVNIISHQL